MALKQTLEGLQKDFPFKNCNEQLILFAVFFLANNYVLTQGHAGRNHMHVAFKL